MSATQDPMAIQEVADQTRMTKGALANRRYLGVGGPAYHRLSPRHLVYRRDTVTAWVAAAERTGTAA